MDESLGSAIRRLRLAAGYTLREFAQKLGISAAHQSDIEHSRRMPGDKVLDDSIRLLRHVGASDELRKLDPRLSPELQEWVNQTPEVAQLLREMKDSGRSASEVLKRLQQMLNADIEREEEP